MCVTTVSTALNKCYVKIADAFTLEIMYCLCIVLFIFVKDNEQFHFLRNIFLLLSSALFPHLTHLRKLFRDQEAASSIS